MNKLTAPQINALIAAEAGTLRWAFPVLSGGGYFIDNFPAENVNVRTGDALLTRGLIQRPVEGPGRAGGSGACQITRSGREALSQSITPA